MATISKFYFHDAATPNTGTMPTGVFVDSSGAGSNDRTGDSAGARTARDANDVVGTANPDTVSTITSTANTTEQSWGHRRFVSRPLAAQTFQGSDGNWSFSYARDESNLLHNQSILCAAYCWRPSTGLALGSFGTANNSCVLLSGTEPTVAATVQAETVTAPWNLSNPVTILNGDILVFEVFSDFLQGMSTAYTDNFHYDGTTEASVTTCASFVTPPRALTLFTAPPAVMKPEIFSAIPFAPTAGGPTMHR